MPKSSSEDLERRLEQLKKSRKGRKERALGVRSNDRSLATVPSPAPAAPPNEDNVADLLFDARATGGGSASSGCTPGSTA